MAAHQILKSLQRAEFSQRLPALGPHWLMETVELSDRLSEGIHRGTMCPLRGSEVSLLTTAPLVKFVFL